ncbi:MAG: nitroreductase family deazaflavin-dependent oxidoreductase [Chloroflexi bacterium]|nr:nitroreductase family deazaflavin-dependent oxidoreductase [Chloroflexota bacterium]
MTPQDERLLTQSPVLDLTTTGRTSGQLRTVELWFAYEQGDVYFLTGNHHWRRNLEAYPAAEVRISRHSFKALLEPVTDQAITIDHVMALFQKKYGDEVMQRWYEGQEHVVVRLKITG